MRVYKLPAQKLNLGAVAQKAMEINSKKLPVYAVDKSGVVDLFGIGKIYPGSDYVIPEHGYHDPGMKNIVNGRTHGGRGFKVGII